MASKALTWDDAGTRKYRAGVSKGVLYLLTNGVYSKGVAWNGLINVTKSPDGAEANDLWADNIKYGSIRSAENAKGSIEAYIYPDEFDACMGNVPIATGVTIGQQAHAMFGLCWRTEVGDDQHAIGEDGAGYVLHIVYGMTVNPTEESDDTINDSPDAMTMSWDWETTPVIVTGHKPTATIDINSWTANATKLEALEKILYGSDGAEARLPLPDEIATLMAAA